MMFQTESAATYQAFRMNMLRDQLSVSGWLLLGATLQSLVTVSVLPSAPKYVWLPAILLAGFKVANTLLIIAGAKQNPAMQGVDMGRISPDLNKDPQGTDRVVCFLLGVQCNHPLGLLAPGFTKITKYFDAMTADLTSKPEEYGLLGQNSFLGTGAAQSNQLVNIYYFRNATGLHKFAHSASHREGWLWWDKAGRHHQYVGIFHESYEAPLHGVESIYSGMKPTGLGRTQYKAESGDKEYVTLLSNVGHGKRRTAAGRMGVSNGQDNPEFEYGVGYD